MKELYIITSRVDDDYKKVVVASDTFDKVKKLYPGQLVRIDHITELLKVTKETLSKLITINEKTRFPYGLLINEQYILSEELVLFKILDICSLVKVPSLTSSFKLLLYTNNPKTITARIAIPIPEYFIILILRSSS